jgi:hypothetical protein
VYGLVMRSPVSNEEKGLEVTVDVGHVGLFLFG